MHGQFGRDTEKHTAITFLCCHKQITYAFALTIRAWRLFAIFKAIIKMRKMLLTSTACSPISSTEQGFKTTWKRIFRINWRRVALYALLQSSPPGPDSRKYEKRFNAAFRWNRLAADNFQLKNALLINMRTVPKQLWSPSSMVPLNNNEFDRRTSNAMHLEIEELQFTAQQFSPPKLSQRPKWTLIWGRPENSRSRIAEFVNRIVACGIPSPTMRMAHYLPIPWKNPSLFSKQQSGHSPSNSTRSNRYIKQKAAAITANGERGKNWRHYRCTHLKSKCFTQNY